MRLKRDDGLVEVQLALCWGEKMIVVICIKTAVNPRVAGKTERRKCKRTALIWAFQRRWGGKDLSYMDGTAAHSLTAPPQRILPW
jgi:hypothetical protein